MFSRALRLLYKPAACGKTPKWARAVEVSPRMSTPSMRALPLSGVSTPYVKRRLVDLPAPFGPSKPVISPSRAVKDTSFTAVMEPKRFTSDCASIMARAHLGVLPHAAGLYNNLSARENIAYFGSLQGMTRETVRSRTEELARTLGMEAFMDRRAKGFSQGQRLKVALARALVHDPGNLILDEPTNGLDVMAIRGLRDMLRSLKVQGRCILFSSHVM